MTEAKFLKLFKEHIFYNHGTQAAAAEHWGVSVNFVSLVVNGIRVPNSGMLGDMGVVAKKEVIKQTIRTYTKAV